MIKIAGSESGTRPDLKRHQAVVVRLVDRHTTRGLRAYPKKACAKRSVRCIHTRTPEPLKKECRKAGLIRLEEPILQLRERIAIWQLHPENHFELRRTVNGKAVHLIKDLPLAEWVPRAVDMIRTKPMFGVRTNESDELVIN